MSKILLIEPDQDLRQTILSSLKSHGHTVRTCAGAQSAIHAVDKFKPDLVILELQLAVHNGIEFLYELRSYDDWRYLPVIIHSFISPAQQAISPMLWDQLNIKQYLYKPNTKLSHLVSAIDDVLVEV